MKPSIRFSAIKQMVVDGDTFDQADMRCIWSVLLAHSEVPLDHLGDFVEALNELHDEYVDTGTQYYWFDLPVLALFRVVPSNWFPAW